MSFKQRNYGQKSVRRAGIVKTQSARRTASRNTRFSARRASAQQVQLLRKNAGEKKGVDILLTQAAIISTTNTNANSTVLNLVQTGNGSWNRVGKQVYLKSVRLRGSCIMRYAPDGITGEVEMDFLRMVVVWDKQPSGGTIPTWDTIFGYTLQDGTEGSTVLSGPRYDNMGRFQVLRDVIINAEETLTPVTNAAVQMIPEIECSFDEYIKLGNKTSIYSGQSAPMTIADISTGALYVYWRSTPQLAGTSQWTVTDQSMARLRYSD